MGDFNGATAKPAGHGVDGFAVTCERTGRTVRTLVSGELDIATAAQLRGLCEGEHDSDAEEIIVDLSGVTFMDSTGLHALTDTAERCGKRLRLILSAPAAHLIDLTRMRDKLPIIQG